MCKVINTRTNHNDHLQWFSLCVRNCLDEWESTPTWETTVSLGGSVNVFREGLAKGFQRWWSNVVNNFVHESYIRIKDEVIKTEQVIHVYYGTVVKLRMFVQDLSLVLSTTIRKLWILSQCYAGFLLMHLSVESKVTPKCLNSTMILNWFLTYMYLSTLWRWLTQFELLITV